MPQRQPPPKEPDQQVIRLINNLKRLGLSQTRAFRLPLLSDIPLNTFQNWLLLYRNISPKWRARLEEINNFLDLQPSPPALTMIRTDREIYRPKMLRIFFKYNRRLLGELCRSGCSWVSGPPGAFESRMGGPPSLLAAHGFQCPQPGPGQDKKRGRAGGQIHDPASFAPGAALFLGERGQDLLSVWERRPRDGAHGLPGVHRPGDLPYSR